MSDPIVFYVPDQDTIYLQSRDVGPQGPPGQSAIDVSNEIDLATSGTKDVYTAVSNNTSIIGVCLRATAVSGYSTAPVIYFRRDTGAKLFCVNTALNGFNLVNEQYTFWFTGVSPVLSSGDKLQLVVSTPADGAFTVEIDVYGQIIGGDANS